MKCLLTVLLLCSVLLQRSTVTGLTCQNVTCDFETPSSCGWTSTTNVDYILQWEIKGSVNRYPQLDVAGRASGSKGRLISPWLDSQPGRSCQLRFRYLLGASNGCRFSVGQIWREADDTMYSYLLWTTVEKSEVTASGLSAFRNATVDCYLGEQYTIYFEGERLNASSKACGDFSVHIGVDDVSCSDVALPPALPNVTITTRAVTVITTATSSTISNASTSAIISTTTATNNSSPRAPAPFSALGLPTPAIIGIAVGGAVLIAVVVIIVVIVLVRRRKRKKKEESESWAASMFLVHQGRPKSVEPMGVLNASYQNTENDRSERLRSRHDSSDHNKMADSEASKPKVTRKDPSNRRVKDRKHLTSEQGHNDTYGRWDEGVEYMTSSADAGDASFVANKGRQPMVSQAAIGDFYNSRSEGRNYVTSEGDANKTYSQLSGDREQMESPADTSDMYVKPSMARQPMVSQAASMGRQPMVSQAAISDFYNRRSKGRDHVTSEGDPNDTFDAWRRNGQPVRSKDALNDRRWAEGNEQMTSPADTSDTYTKPTKGRQPVVSQAAISDFYNRHSKGRDPLTSEGDTVSHPNKSRPPMTSQGDTSDTFSHPNKSRPPVTSQRDTRNFLAKGIQPKMTYDEFRDRDVSDRMSSSPGPPARGVTTISSPALDNYPANLNEGQYLSLDLDGPRSGDEQRYNPLSKHTFV